MTIGTSDGGYHEDQLSYLVSTMALGATEKPAGELKSEEGTQVAGGEQWDNRYKPNIPYLDPKQGSTPVTAPILPMSPILNEGLPRPKPGQKLSQNEKYEPLNEREWDQWFRNELPSGGRIITGPDRNIPKALKESPQGITVPDTHPNLKDLGDEYDIKAIPEIPGHLLIRPKQQPPLVSDADERPVAGKQYAMADDPNKKNVIDFPAGRGEGGGGGGKVISATQRFEDKKLNDAVKDLAAGRGPELSKKDPALFNRAIQETQKRFKEYYDKNTSKNEEGLRADIKGALSAPGGLKESQYKTFTEGYARTKIFREELAKEIELESGTMGSAKIEQFPKDKLPGMPTPEGAKAGENVHHQNFGKFENTMRHVYRLERLQQLYKMHDHLLKLERSYLFGE